MTLYIQGISSCQIAGAVAAALLHDLRVNNLTFPGFPQVFVPEPVDGVFTISLSFKECTESFQLTMDEAVAAVKKLKSSKTYSAPVYEPTFDRIQEAVAQLEGKVRQHKRHSVETEKIEPVLIDN